jgi:hypothetical protein
MSSRSWQQDSFKFKDVKIPSSEYCTVEDHSKNDDDDAWREVQESSDTSRNSKNTLSFLPQKTKFRQKCFQKQMCSTPYTYSTLARWRVSSGRQMICNLWLWQKVVVCMCVTSEWQWNSTNISAYLWTQYIFHVSFTTRQFVGSSFKRA